MRTKAILRSKVFAMGTLCVMLPFSFANAQQIGVVASLQPQVFGTAPGQAERSLQPRSGVLANDTIRTGPSGRSQLLFQDQTTLTVAPSSQVVLDRFVFDPAGEQGQVGLSLTTGALRFIGGQGSRNTQAEIRTPSATLGIRGSSALVRHMGGQTVAVLIAGERMCITVGAQQSCTSRRGGVLTEQGFQGQVNPEFLAFLLGQIDGSPQPGLASRTDGIGLSDQAPPNRQPLSSGGRERDEGAFDSDGRPIPPRGPDGPVPPTPIAPPAPPAPPTPPMLPGDDDEADNDIGNDDGGNDDDGYGDDGDDGTGQNPLL